MKKINNLLSFEEHGKLRTNKKRTKRTEVGGDILLEKIKIGGHIIAIVNSEGGVGKTTVAMMLANGLKKRGKAVLFVDAATPHAYFGSAGEENYSSLPGVQELVKCDYTRVVLADADAQEGDISLGIPVGEKFRGQLLATTDKEIRLRGFLSTMEAEYDYIIIDTPPSITENQIMVFNALAAAHSVIIPVQAHFTSMAPITHTLNAISLVHNRLNPALEIEGILVTKVTDEPASQKAVQQVLSYFQTVTFPMTIPKSPAYINEPGKPTKEFLDGVVDDIIANDEELSKKK